MLIPIFYFEDSLIGLTKQKIFNTVIFRSFFIDWNAENQKNLTNLCQPKPTNKH